MVSGKVTKKNAYKSSNGFFIGINGNDYMFFGQTDIEVGDNVVAVEGKPSKSGTPTIKSIAVDDIEAFAIDEDKSRSGKIFRAHDQPSTCDQIKRLACMKMAVRLVVDEGMKQGTTPTEMAARVKEIADELEKVV